MRTKALKSIFIILTVLLCASSSFAIKVSELPFASDAYLGFVTGIGEGINFGFSAGVDIRDFKVGAELEQLITDVNYSAGINATRFGGLVKYNVAEDIFVNFHMGAFQFQVKTRDIAYSSGGTNYLLLAGTQRYTGKYQALSIDIPWGNFKITPKFVVNSIDGGGSFNEFNLNLGAEF